MAKASKKSASPAPQDILLRLDAPGMTPLHRAGLGGLAATLRYADVKRRQIEEDEEDMPEILAPLLTPEFTWNVESKSIRLNFGSPDNAGRFFEALSKFAFQIQDGAIYLPGQYRIDQPPHPSRRRMLQKGMTLTFLQHGKTRSLGEEETATYEYKGHSVEYRFKPCSSYVHQDKWKEWIDSKGRLTSKPCSFQGPFYPGAVVRHIAFAGATGAAQSVGLSIALTFALVGTVSYQSRGGLGVLVIPQVDDLRSFAQRRNLITPYEVQDTFIASLSDAVLRFALNELGGKVETSLSSQSSGGSCEGVCFRTVPWSTQQKSRCETQTLKSPSTQMINAYSVALRHFKPRMISQEIEIKEGKGKAAAVSKKTEYFWKDSVFRSFVADNLVQDKYWFEGFTQFSKKLDFSGKNTMWTLLRYEKKELNEMVNDEKLDWKLDGAKTLVLAVQEALRNLYGKASSSAPSKAAIGNRLDSEYEKWRIAFAGAKTPEQFRNSFADMLSRAKTNSQMADDWHTVVKLILEDWSLARDLALLALASYKGSKIDEGQEQDSDVDA